MSEPQHHPFFHIGGLEQLAREMAGRYPDSPYPPQMLRRLKELADELRGWQPPAEEEEP